MAGASISFSLEIYFLQPRMFPVSYTHLLCGFPEHHPIAHFRHPPQSYTEIELVTDSITEILCVWSLTGENQKISCLS